MLPPSLTKRLVNHARPNDVTEGYAADWTVAQLREPAQKIADRIEALMQGSEGARVRGCEGAVAHLNDKADRRSQSSTTHNRPKGLSL